LSAGGVKGVGGAYGAVQVCKMYIHIQ
jgi:hypothetical protein